MALESTMLHYLADEKEHIEVIKFILSQLEKDQRNPYDSKVDIILHTTFSKEVHSNSSLNFNHILGSNFTKWCTVRHLATLNFMKECSLKTYSIFVVPKSKISNKLDQN